MGGVTVLVEVKATGGSVCNAQVQLSRNQVQRMQNTGPGEQYRVMVVGVQRQTHGFFTADQLEDLDYTYKLYRARGDGQEGRLTQKQPGNGATRR
jgi:hypothetical protein